MSYPIPSLGLSSLPLSGQSIAPSASATASFAVSAWPGTRLVELSVSGQTVWVTFDGSVPTATNGLIIPSGLAPFTWSINRVARAGFRSATGSANVYGVPLVG